MSEHPRKSGTQVPGTPATGTQAGISGQVVDLTAARFDREQSPLRARLEAEKARDDARFDVWVASLGGFASDRFWALYAEARELAGPDRCWQYLDMAQKLDEGSLIDLAADDDRAAPRHGAVMARELVRRLDAAQAARLRRSAEIRLAQDQAAIDSLVERSAELQSAMADLKADPRVAAVLDADLTGRASMTPAEVSAELYASMGLAARPPTSYEASMPAVGDLARTIGVKR